MMLSMGAGIENSSFGKMEQKCTTEKVECLITWRRAWLLALGWLVCTCVPAAIPPIVVELYDIDLSQSLTLALFVALYILLFITVMIATRLVHHSWRVSIAFLAEVCLAAALLGLLAVLLIFAAMSGMAGPYY